MKPRAANTPIPASNSKEELAKAATYPEPPKILIYDLNKKSK